MKTRFIFNPRSGRNTRNPRLLERTRAFIAAHNLNATVVITDRPRHAAELARRAVDEDCGLVVAIGGDGTMNEVAAVLAGTSVVFGLIPYGSGNGLARHLGIPLRIPAALDNLLTGKPRLMDSGLINDHPFFCAAGFGFEARIARAFEEQRSRGLSGYLLASARAIWQCHPEVCQIHIGQSQISVRAFTIVAANACQYGSNAVIAPGARVDDGLLDLVAVPPLNPINALPLVWRLFCGALDHDKAVVRLRGEHFVINRSAPGLIHTDGETHETGATLDIRVRPLSLRLMEPAGV